MTTKQQKQEDLARAITAALGPHFTATIDRDTTAIVEYHPPGSTGFARAVVRLGRIDYRRTIPRALAPDVARKAHRLFAGQAKDPRYTETARAQAQAAAEASHVTDSDA